MMTFEVVCWILSLLHSELKREVSGEMQLLRELQSFSPIRLPEGLVARMKTRIGISAKVFLRSSDALSSIQYD